MTLREKTSSSRYTDAEWKTRLDLAACYRIADMYGFSDIIWNHITAKIPDSESFLINRFGLRYDEVTASNLVTLNLEGEVIDPGSASSEKDVNVTGFIIHSAIHAARPDLHCIMHSHSSAGLAVSVLKDGLAPMIQDAMQIYGRIAYHDYQGLSTEASEREGIATSLGSENAMILRNHGLLTCGESVGEAFMLMYYLERACSVQMQVLSSGQEYQLIPREMCEKAAEQYSQFPYGKFEWPALLRLVEKHSPDYRS